MTEENKERINLNEVMPEKKENLPTPEEKSKEVKEEKPING